MDDKLKSYGGAMVTSLPYLHEHHVAGVDGVLVYARRARARAPLNQSKDIYLVAF